MSNPLKIAIPQPCHEKWNQMTPAAQGRFCDSCQKNVIDFTNASDREIASKIEIGGDLCGRFRISQLDRNLLLPKEKSLGWKVAASGVLAILGSNIGSAQTNPPQTQPVTVHISNDDPRIMGKVLPPENRLHTVSGVVSDATGPIPGANVVVEGTQRATQTDIDGRFEVKAKQGDTLIASSLGMEEAKYVISDHFNGILITMEGNEFVTSGIVVTVEKRGPKTFFGRVFHSIGNIFR